MSLLLFLKWVALFDFALNISWTVAIERESNMAIERESKCIPTHKQVWIGYLKNNQLKYYYSFIIHNPNFECTSRLNQLKSILLQAKPQTMFFFPHSSLHTNSSLGGWCSGDVYTTHSLLVVLELSPTISAHLTQLHIIQLENNNKTANKIVERKKLCAVFAPQKQTEIAFYWWTRVIA